jgi:tRNA modification GTPase
MVLKLDDTITALASAPGVSGRGIVRVSGGDVRRVLEQHFTPRDGERWTKATRAERHVGEWRLAVDVPWDDAPFQNGLRLPVEVGLWPTKRSYTGQPLAELHLIGSPPLLEAVLTQLCRSGCRAARPGEFTLRAFLAGRLDLLQAEAVLGVIDAADHVELEQALQQLAGGISQRMGTLRADLLDLLADLEAGLDFVDEDIEFVSREQLLSRVAAAQRTIAELCDQASRRLQSSARPRVVLAGLPNAGKSTLLNALTGQSAALVSEVSGTTRDYLCVPLDRDGLHVDLIDTAGWDSKTSGIDAVAQQRRHEQWQHADLIVWCSDL